MFGEWGSERGDGGVGAVCLALREREVRVGRGEEIDRIERLSAYIAYI